MAAKPDQPFESMTFGDHLEELRRRVLLSLALPLPLSVLIFFLNNIFHNALIEWLRLPASHALRANGLSDQMQVLTPTEMVVLQMKLSLIAALVLSAPWVLYQAWKFIEPGLYAHEKRFVHFLLPFSAVLSVAGLSLLYFAMLPLMLRVLIAFGMIGTSSSLDPQVEEIMKQQPVPHVVTTLPATPRIGDAYFTWPAMDLYVATAGSDGQARIVEVTRSWVNQQYRLSEYINLVLMLMLAVAIAFQMPLVIALLGWLGIASPQWLRKQRRYALMVCGVVAIAITPPDALSALIMLVPLYGLYELGILLLVIAPASAVAEGRVFSLRRFREPEPDNRREPMDQPREPEYPVKSTLRKSPLDQDTLESADRGEQRR